MAQGLSTAPMPLSNSATHISISIHKEMSLCIAAKQKGNYRPSLRNPVRIASDTGHTIASTIPSTSSPVNIAINVTNGCRPICLPTIFGSTVFLTAVITRYRIKIPNPSEVFPNTNKITAHGSKIPPVPNTGRISDTAIAKAIMTAYAIYDSYALRKFSHIDFLSEQAPDATQLRILRFQQRQLFRKQISEGLRNGSQGIPKKISVHSCQNRSFCHPQ